jgi:hypothetical protein
LREEALLLALKLAPPPAFDPVLAETPPSAKALWLPVPGTVLALVTGGSGCGLRMQANGKRHRIAAAMARRFLGTVRPQPMSPETAKHG